MATLSIIFKLVIEIVSWLIERDKERKKKKGELLKEAKNAIKNKDTSAITASLDKLHRL